MHPRYPIYVISKGRWERPLTARALTDLGVSYSIVVEPHEASKYRASLSDDVVLELPFSNLGQGSIPARNWVWEHAISTGATSHWILDDNIRGFYRLYKNFKVPVARGGTVFWAAEEFVDRYDNIGEAGFNYFMFASRKTKIPPYYPNTRVYSCILLRNGLPFRWRGRYNEDTDLSLRILKAGWSTVLFNAFLAYKETTMTMKGGNTDELYQGDGRRLMAESLIEQHPDVTKLSWKWGRWQHQVDYTPFRRNEMRRKPDYRVARGVDNFGMIVQQLRDGIWETVDDFHVRDPETTKRYSGRFRYES